MYTKNIKHVITALLMANQTLIFHPSMVLKLYDMTHEPKKKKNKQNIYIDIVKKTYI
jgi:predicted RNA-binding protein associated with RNAse of E/G family